MFDEYGNVCRPEHDIAGEYPKCEACENANRCILWQTKLADAEA